MCICVLVVAHNQEIKQHPWENLQLTTFSDGFALAIIIIKKDF